MGILAYPASVVESLNWPKGFSVAELGNQVFRAAEKPVMSAYWYRHLGCERYVSIDANGSATHFADLNYPIPTEYGLEGQFDAATDFGTGEHVFNQAQVFHTLHDLVKVGGVIIIDRPKVGWAGHCFYLLQETLIRDLASANAYKVLKLDTHTIEGHGDVLFALMQKTVAKPFQYPNQGKYKAMLKVAPGTPANVEARTKRWDVLTHLVTNNRWRRGAEIGVLNGATFFQLLDRCPALSMIAVDQWATDAPDYGDLTKVGEEFQEQAKAYGERARILRGSSAEMACQVDDASLDFCFVDAEHTFVAASADIAAWAPKVKKGGAIMGHDINLAPVAAAVMESLPGRKIEMLPDNVWLVAA